MLLRSCHSNLHAQQFPCSRVIYLPCNYPDAVLGKSHTKVRLTSYLVILFGKYGEVVTNEGVEIHSEKDI
jgi:hypothetical protein